MDKLKSPSQTLSEAPIPVKTKKQNMFIKPSNILYIEARSSGNLMKTLNRTYIIREDIHSLEVKLQQNNFFRCHRSYLVNFKRVKEIVPSGRTFQIILDTGEKIPLSRKQEKILRMKLQQK